MLTKSSLESITGFLKSRYTSVHYHYFDDTLYLQRKPREDDGGVLEKTFRLFIDQGYYRGYQQKVGETRSYSRMFNPEDPLHPDIANERRPSLPPDSELEKILKTCEEAGGYPCMIDIEIGNF